MTSDGSTSSKSRSRAATFENSYKQLEEIVRKLEAGQLTLDESTGLFEDGMKLAKRCNELLTGAELKIQRLQAQFAEQMNLVPDDEDSDGLEDEDDED